MESAIPTGDVAAQSSGVESQEEVSAQPQETKPQKRLEKVKVNGKEEEVDIDSVLRDYQKYRAGDERLSEAVKREQLQKQWLERVKANPMAMFEDLELNAEEWAEQLLLKKIEYETMSPEKREAYEAKKEAERIKAEKEAAEEELRHFKTNASKKEFEQLQLDYSKQLNDAIPEFYKSIGKTTTPERLAAALEHMIAHVEAHGEVPDVKQVLEQFEGRYDAQIKSHLSRLPTAELVQLLSSEQLDGIRKHQLSELSQNNPLRNATKREPGEQVARPKQRRAPMQTDNFFKRLESKYTA